MSIPDPVVLLDARARYVHPAFQMTRASTKTVFDAAGRLVTVPANAIGWDCDPATGQSRGYLSEPEATNLLLHSNDLTQGSWGKTNLSVQSSSDLSKLTEDASNNARYIAQALTIGDGDATTIQCVAKAGERRALWLQGHEVGAENNRFRYCFDIATGEKIRDASSGDAELYDAQIDPLGDGRYHCWISGRLGQGVTSLGVRVWMAADDSSFVYQGDGVSSLYVGYLQAEPGRYPTSYIETGGATAIRSVDFLRLLTAPSVIPWNGLSGTIVTDCLPPPVPPVGAARLFGIDQSAVLSIDDNGLVYAYGSALDSNINMTNIVDNPVTRMVIAISWSPDSVRAAFNGEVSATVSRVQSPVEGNVVAVGNGASGGAGLALGGRIRRFIYYPASLPNADLQSLTAMQE